MEHQNKNKMLYHIAHKKKNEQGNILLSSLLIMLAMNLLGITLMQTSVREFSSANYKTIDSTNFYLAETCLQDSITFLRSQDKPPSTIPDISKTNLSHLYSGTEDQTALNQLGKYSYNCTTSEIVVKSVQASETGYGENIGTGDEYGVSGDLTPRYYYNVDSNGVGPGGSQKRIISIVSAEY